jgi:hypothetical protein
MKVIRSFSVTLSETEKGKILKIVSDPRSDFNHASDLMSEYVEELVSDAFCIGYQEAVNLNKEV